MKETSIIAEQHSQSDWKKFLDMGEQLMKQTTIKGQADFINQYIHDLGSYEADIWFTEGVSRIPGSHNVSLFPPLPPSPLMQKAVEDKEICIIGKGGHPKQYKGSDLPYVVAFPLVVQDFLLGAIQVLRTDSQPLSFAEVEFFDGLSANTAVALQISHQTIIKNWRLEQLALVRTVSQQIANLLDLDELCQKVTQLIRDTFHYYAVTIFTVKPASQHLVFRASAGPFEEGVDPKTLLSAQYGKGIIGLTASEGVERLVNDVARDKIYVSNAGLPHTHSEVAFPLKVEDRVLGVLDIQSEHIYSFHEMDMRVLRSLADNIALAVEGTRLYSAVNRRAEQLAIVSEVSNALSSILDFDTLLKQIVNLIHDRFGYPFVHLFLFQSENNQLVFRAGAGERADILENIGLQYDLSDPNGIIPWVARNGVTLLANNVSEEPHYRPSTIYPSETASEMAVPLQFGSDILGILDIQSDQAQQFDLSDKQLFETLADNIGIAIRNSILYNSERWRRQAADSLREVAGLLSSNIALDKLMDIILQELEQILPCDASAIWLVDADAGPQDGVMPLKLAAVHGASKEEIENACCGEPLCQEWLNHALLEPRPTVRAPQNPYGPLGRALSFSQEHSSIAAPMMVADHPVGIINLAHKSPGKYGQESTQLTSAFASYAAVAIHNTQLYASAQEQAWIATVLLQVAEATQSLTNVDELLQAVVRLTPLLVGVRGCALFLWEENLNSFSLAGLHGLDLKSAKKEEQLWFRPDEAPALQRMLQEKEHCLLKDLQHELPFLKDVSEEDDPAQYVMLPLLSRGILMGACLISYQANRNSSIDMPDDQRLSIIQGIAHQTAIAVENIRLLESQQQETYISAVLLQVAQAVVSNNDLADIFASIVQITQILVGSQACMIYLWNEDEGMYFLAQVNGVSQRSEDILRGSNITPDQARILEYVMLQDATVTLPISRESADNPYGWLDLDPEEEKSIADDLNCQPILIGMPLSVKGESYGVMLVVDPGEEKVYFQKRLEIIQGIARQTSLAIQNDKLQKSQVARESLEHEFQLAREIQRTFLPSDFAQPAGWQLDARWRPARDVGGDFFDIFPLPGQKMALVIADVSDKGISAALYMTLTRTLTRTVAQQEKTPAAILARVNELLLRDTPHGMFVTAILGILDIRTGELVYANAGHNLPLIRRETDRKLEVLCKGSMPLGILENVTFVDHTVTLMPGDTLLMYTDGITEAFSGTEIFGEERLHQALLKPDFPGASIILDGIDAELMAFRGSSQPSDDVTALAIYRKLDE